MLLADDVGIDGESERWPPASREYKFVRAELSEIDMHGIFCGYASLFGHADLGRDIVMPGAFSRSLGKQGTTGIKMLYQHDPGEPIGYWTAIEEDQRGLKVSGQLMTELARAREVLSLMKAGVLDGLSIGFKTIRGRRDKKSGARRLFEVDLWEISIVTFPMLPEARIATVKSAHSSANLPTIREFEHVLTRDAGLTRSQAAVVLDVGYKALISRRDAVGRCKSLCLPDRLRQIATDMRKK